jgi:two-component system sensor histidine kinase KdpD
MGSALQRHRLKVEIASDSPLLPVDYVLMEQVVTNLLSNSAKYAPPGSEIRVSARVQPGQMAEVQVSNQGPPVDEADLERIFDKFHRVTAADRIPGTGLGLSICKGIVESRNCWPASGWRSSIQPRPVARPAARW